MRCTICIIAFVGFVSTAFAASPFAGTWKFNVEKSMSTGKGAPPKEETLVVEEEGDQLRVSLTGTAANGSSIVNKFTVSASGGAASLQQSASDAISVKFISPNIAELSYMSGGKEVSSQHSLVSGDGRTLFLVTRSVSAQGGVIEAVSAFEKQ